MDSILTCNQEYAATFPNTNINPVNSIIAQISSVCFLFASLFTDILLIRIALVIGNGLLFLQSILGWPLFPCWANIPKISVDGAFWGLLTMLLNLWSLTRLLMDEREVTFKTIEDEELWRIFYRRSGIPRLSFKHNILSLGILVNCEKDYEFTEEEIKNYLYLIIEGVVRINTDINGVSVGGFIYLGSGECFDISHVNALGLEVGFLGNSFTAMACTDCKLFAWPVSELNNLGRSASNGRDAFRSFSTHAIAKIAELHLTDKEPRKMEDMSTEKSPDYGPLTDSEKPPPKDRSCRAVLLWICHSIDPRPPVGFRENLHVPTKTLSRKHHLSTV